MFHLALLAVASPLRPTPAEVAASPWLPVFRQHMRAMRERANLTDMTFNCAVCGIAVNEVEGFMLENRTDTEITQMLMNDLCPNFPSDMQALCNEIAQQVPSIIARITMSYTVSAVCIDLGYCAMPFPGHQDPSPIPTYTINLDLPPVQRFSAVCSLPLHQSVAQYLVSTISSILPDGGESFEYIGLAIHDLYIPTSYADEISGCASGLGIPVGWATLLNLGYELSDACTSVVAQLPNGMIVHGRNMDFWAGMGFTDSLKNVSYIANFQRGGVTQYTTTQLAGYVGVLSGMRPGAFSVTVNTRFYPEGVTEFLKEVIVALEERNASLVTFATRDALELANNYAKAVSYLSNVELIADVYYTVAGVSGVQGAVLARNRTQARYTWPITGSGATGWYTGVANYDINSAQPWFDDRWDPTVTSMNAAGKAAFSTDAMLAVMSTKPTLNLQSTYTIIGVPANGTWASWSRWCDYPCVQ